MPKAAKKEKKSKRKHKDKIKKKEKHKHKHSKKERKSKDVVAKSSTDNKDDNDDFSIPVALMNSKSHAPETPEEYKKRSEVLRREVDPVTGRTRLIRGEGEILEEIVSKDRHAQINKSATDGDGKFFQEQTIGKKRNT